MTILNSFVRLFRYALMFVSSENSMLVLVCTHANGWANCLVRLDWLFFMIFQTASRHRKITWFSHNDRMDSNCQHLFSSPETQFRLIRTSMYRLCGLLWMGGNYSSEELMPLTRSLVNILLCKLGKRFMNDSFVLCLSSLNLPKKQNRLVMKQNFTLGTSSILAVNRVS